MEQAIQTSFAQTGSSSPVSLSGCLPLTMADTGNMHTVKVIKGRDDTRRFLESLGFVEGSLVSVVAELGGNVIVSVKDTRVAVSKAMAARIYVL